MNSSQNRHFDSELLVFDAESFQPAILPEYGSEDRPRLLLPGSFNPLHAGHRAMARYAQARFKIPVWMELSIENVDKSTLDLAEIAHRLAQNFGPFGLAITRTPTFLEKARLFRQATFVVGRRYDPSSRRNLVLWEFAGNPGPGNLQHFFAWMPVFGVSSKTIQYRFFSSEYRIVAAAAENVRIRAGQRV